MPLITPRRRFLITAPLALILPAGLLTYLGLTVVNGVEDRYRDQVYTAVEKIVISVRNRSTDVLQYTILSEFRTTIHNEGQDQILQVLRGEESAFELQEPLPYAERLFVYDPETNILFLERQAKEDAENGSQWAVADNFHAPFVNRLKSDMDIELETFRESHLIPTEEFHFLAYPDDVYVSETQRELVCYFWLKNEASAERAPDPPETWLAFGFTIDFAYVNETFFPNLLSAMWQREGELRYPIAIEDRVTGKRVAAVAPNFSDFKTSSQYRATTFSDKFPWYLLHFADGTGEDIMDVANNEKIVYYCLIAAANVIMIVGVFGTLRNIARELDISEMRSNFVARVSHDLRTPLGLIRLYAETLEMGRTKDEHTAKEYLRSILKESERLSHLINNILSFSQMEAETKRYNLTRSSLEDAVLDVVESMSYHMKRHGFELEVDLADDLPNLSMDPAAIQQALYNLLSNALKYSGEGKKIEIRAYVENQYAVITVKDYGIGIARAEQKKIFQEFYRVEDPRVRETGGSGLGLAVVKHIVDGHGGKLEVESRPGAGSTFTLRLPVQPVSR